MKEKILRFLETRFQESLDSKLLRETRKNQRLEREQYLKVFKPPKN